MYEISKRLARDNDVYIYTTDPTGKLPKQEFIEGMNVLRFKSFAPNEAFYFSPQLYFALRKQNCDILHVHSFHAFPSLIAYWAVKKFKKLIFTPHYHPVASTPLRNFMHTFYDRFQIQLFLKAYKTICVSGYEVNLINKKFNIPKEKLVNIPNGIDIESFRNSPDTRNKDIFQILYVGRLEKYKRIHWVLFSLKEILNEFSNKKIHFTIVGNGPFEKELKKIVNGLNLNAFVDFKSNLSRGELVEEYYKCNVFVMPSEYEAFSISTLEALSCGRPVIVTNVGFLSEISNGNGFTIESNSDLTKRLSQIIENGNITVNFDSRKYSWDEISKKISKVYGE